MKSEIVERIPQFVLVMSAVLLAWLWMQTVHELGHVLHAWATGGTVQRVTLHPLTISFTDVRPNPRPLAVAWGGVIWGALLPLGLWGAAGAIAPKYAWLLRFFAGFCLIANGVYLAAAVWQPVGDAKLLLELGSPLWLLGAGGVATAAAGLWCWNGLGRHFGWKMPHGEVDARIAWATATLLVVTVAAELILSPL
jgi:hypothetical protein